INVFERQLEILLDVATLARARRACAAAARARARLLLTHAAEEGLEEIRERVLAAEHLVDLVLRHRAIAALAAAEGHVPACTRLPAEPGAALGAGLFVHPPVRTELVVLLALRGVAEHLVRFVDFLEARFGGLVARIDVGVMLARELAEGLLDFLLGRGLRDAKRRVVILEVHEQSSVSVLIESELATELVELLVQPAPCVARRQRFVAHQRAKPLHDLRDLEQPLHTREIDSGAVDKTFDELQTFELLARIEAHAADRPGRLYQTEALVLAERLRVHAQQARRHADEKQFLVHARSWRSQTLRRSKCRP